MFRLVERLPSHSRYKAALADDEDLAPHLAALPTATAFGLEGWTPERALLTAIVEWLQAIYSASVAPHTKSGKGPPVKPLPRPTTAVDRFRREESERRIAGLFAQLLPEN